MGINDRRCTTHVDALPCAFGCTGSRTKHSCGTSVAQPRRGVSGKLSLTNTAEAQLRHSPGTMPGDTGFQSLVLVGLCWWSGNRCKYHASRGKYTYMLDVSISMKLDYRYKHRLFRFWFTMLNQALPDLFVVGPAYICKSLTNSPGSPLQRVSKGVSIFESMIRS